MESNISPKPNVSLSECFDNESLPGCYEFLYGGGDEDSNDLPVFETVTGETMSIPMINFSSITRQTGIATLVNPQYVISVNHNQGYRDIQFGDSSSKKPTTIITIIVWCAVITICLIQIKKEQISGKA